MKEKKTKKFHILTSLNFLSGATINKVKKNNFTCSSCNIRKIGTIYYYCNGCLRSFHEECITTCPVFISPCHPKYPLQLIKVSYSNIIDKEILCHSCGIPVYLLAYYSSVFDLVLDPYCANKRELPPINNLKRHEHTLHYFPRKVPLTCDVCGTYNDNKVCFYICHQCGFVVHITCLNLPRVIQTSRHSHRLFYTSSLSSRILSCGVCHREIDGAYGEYSCSKSCAYAMHCKCAMQPQVCDGKELEDEPEKEENNIKTYEKIGDGFIRHFSHPQHIMKFDQDIGESYYEKKQCEACLLPLSVGSSTYRCMECDFVLHEACAYVPSIKQSILHAHPLILKPGNNESYFVCDSCNRVSFGFKYTCQQCWISFDVRCASISEPVHHPSHQHPLFLLYSRSILDGEPCLICGNVFHQLLNCVTCDFALCLCCATLPYKVKHEDDEHWLTLFYTNNAIYPYCHWCQICEENMDLEKGHYSCSECGTTFHTEYIIGTDPYMKPSTKYIYQYKIDIVPNNHLIRPICSYCRKRCTHKLNFISGTKIVCSSACSSSKIRSRFIKQS